MQVTPAHDRRYLTFKMAAEVLKKYIREKENLTIHFPEAVSKAKVTTQERKVTASYCVMF